MLDVYKNPYGNLSNFGLHVKNKLKGVILKNLGDINPLNDQAIGHYLQQNIQHKSLYNQKISRIQP